MEEFSIDTGQSIQKNVQRILAKEIECIRKHCKKHPDTHYSIHEIRKSFKRIRAVLRMIRDGIGYSTYYRENIFYRDLSKRFSEIRDYEVLNNSLEGLNNNHGAELEMIRVEKVREYLKNERDRLFEGLMVEEDLFKKVSASLISGKERIHNFVLDNLEFETCSFGIRRLYKRGVKLKSESGTNGSLETVHRFRKTSKYLQYLMQMLIPLYPELLGAYVKSLKKLTDALGVYRDLGLLDHYLKSNRINGLSLKHVDVFSKLIISDRNLIYKDSMYSAELVYTEDADSFINRIIAYWNFNQKIN